MTKLIMNRRPVGRFGNHLFQKNLLDQLSSHYELEVFHPTFIGADISKSLKKNKFERGLLSVNSRKLNELLDPGISWNVIDALITEEINAGRNLIVPPGVMGLRFFETVFVDPSKVGNLSNIFLKNPKERSTYIGMHFRGTDFKAWNEMADIGWEYYIAAAEMLMQSQPRLNNAPIFLVTDDPQHETVLRIQKSCKVSVVSSQGMFHDFSLLLNSAALIASPSTFSFWAAVIGQVSTVTFPIKWTNYREEVNDPFWYGVANKSTGILGDVYLI